ncbi:MAG: U32 family peptidase [Prevotella sp.]|nr:U32 family peptidase [Prevotella sp.]
MRALELLSPAKNLECGIAAIDHGADAVYIGAPRFGARAAVGNSVEDIRKLCDYAHLFGAKIYVTVNTIIYDDELDDTRQLLSELKKAGVDAILVQDMAIPGMNSGITLHASTQTDNRTSEKVRWLRDIGFSRVVLARELSANEIAAIHSEVPDIELEVFVHGALCVSYSGICYASQYCFGRSANRGECAQFCRMKFSLQDADGREIEHERYLLSLKDMNQSDSLEQLVMAGATSFKIEGRLKDISYVKNVTAAYSQRLNEIIRNHPDKYCRSSKGVCSYSFTPDLRKTFNRGYTHYFLNGRQPDIASFDTPKAMGEYVGVVKELRHDSFNVAGVASFANGDGLCFINQQGVLEGFRANRVVGNRIYPYRMPQGLHAGVRLYRNSDQEFDRLLSRQSAERRIPISVSLRAVAEGFALSAQGVSVSFPCEHQEAKKSPIENIRRQLSKLGDTIYTCTDVDIPSDFNYFIPNSILSDMRRALVAELEKNSRITEGQAPCEVSAKKSIAEYSDDYLLNISNHLSQRFYGAEEKSAFELKTSSELKNLNGPIMQCRHCIRYSLGYCVKNGGKRPEWHEPLSLILGDGRRFRLEFDCQHCQMNIYAT